MPRLSNRDKLEILTRNLQFMADLKEINAPFDLSRTLSPEVQPTNAVLRKRIKHVLGWSDISPDSIRNLLKKLRNEALPDDALTHAVSVIPDKKILGVRDEPTIYHLLRDGRFLKLEIDLTAANKKDLLNEVGEYITAYQPKQVRSHRKAKRHKSTSYIDVWDVYDEWKSGKRPYQIAQQAYRRNRTGSTANFSSNTAAFKAVKRAIKAAKDMIARLPYPQD